MNLIFHKIHSLNTEIGASYMMLDVTGLNLGELIANNPQSIAAISVAGKFLLAVFSAFIVRRIDNHFKLKEIEAEKKKR